MDSTSLSQPEVTSHRRGYQIAKRAIDVGFCLLVMPFTLPLMAIFSLLVHLDSPGPALLVQERVGKDRRHFGMYKFRTMPYSLDNSTHKASMRAYVKGELGEGESKATHKPFQKTQVTRMVQILRKTSLDELPQVINVLKGEMSLVGPRPNVPWEVEAYQPWHMQRLEVLPGITGLAQVNGRSCISFDSLVQYDLEYIERQGLLLDLQILWRTLPHVLTARGAR